MSSTVCLGREIVWFHLDFRPHPAMAREPFRLRKFVGTSVRIVVTKTPPGLSEVIQTVPNFGLEAIRFFPFGVGANAPSNSLFDRRNIARIGFFACPISLAFRSSS
jgi:hypothetical protein